MKKIIKVGNLFEFAQNRLLLRLRRGEITGFTFDDVIDNMIKVRKYLDKYGKLKISNLTDEEKKKNTNESRKRYYLKTGR